MNKKTKSQIENSGLMSHLKAIDCLKNNGWSVIVSPYYYDGVSESVREIDIVAEKQFNSFHWAGSSSAQVNVQLFVECKYINQEIVLWFDKTDKDKAVEALGKATGLQIAVRRSGDISPDSFRYYKAENVAKLFSTTSGREDLIYRALSQCLRALVYYTQWAPGPIRNDFNRHPEAISHIVRYPIVVCGNFSNLKKLEFESPQNFSAKDLISPFLLETNYVYFNKAKTSAIDDYFWIDFVDLDKLEEFLKNLESEAKAILEAKSLIQNIQRTRN